jgi:hypothetical protein
MTAALLLVVPPAALASVPFFRAGLPRVRLLVGWLGTLLLAGEAAVAVYMLGTFAAYVFEDDTATTVAAAAVVVWAAGAITVACITLLLGFAQRQTAARQFAELRS